MDSIRTSAQFLAFFLTVTLLTACKRPPLSPPVVLFDQAHGQKAMIDDIRLNDLSKFASLFKDQGFQVKTNRTSLTDTLLEKIDALIISGLAAPLTNQELESVGKYLNNGGQLCLMLGAASPAANLLAALRVAVANKIVHERQNIIAEQSQNFSVFHLPAHPLTKKLDSFNLYGAWPLKTALEANVIASTSETAWVDLDNDNRLGKNDASQSFAVLVTGQLGHGHFVILGDDTLFQNNFLTGGNLQLGKNLASWFKEGSYY